MSAADLELQSNIGRIRLLLPPIQRNEIWKGSWNGARVAIDCEWDSETGELELVGVGNQYRICQFWWKDLDDAEKHDVQVWLEYLVRHHPVVYHHCIVDIKKLRENGFEIDIECHDNLDDTMLMDAVLNSEEEHTLEYLGINYGKMGVYKYLSKIAPSEYNACDLVETCFVHAELKRQFANDPAAWRIYCTESLAYLPLQLEQEEFGIRVNKPLPPVLHAKFSEKVEQGQRLANAAFGREILLSSPEQKMHALYNVDDFPVQRLRDDKPTINKDALAALRKLRGTEWDAEDDPTLESAWANIEAGGHPLLEAMYLYSGAQQSLSHFVVPFLLFEGEQVVGVRDRIYPEVRIHSQASGRHGYVGPPLTQLRGLVERQITPDRGYCWVGHDWSNIETWLLGALALDRMILAAKAQGWDTHTINFCDATGTPRPPKLTKAIHTCGCADCSAWRREYKWLGDEDLRRTFFKRFVYRLHYRGKAENCADIPGARALGFNIDRLVAASERYLAAHQAIVDYWATVDAQVDREGLVRTFMGRPRRLMSEFRNAKLREASNHGMQGGVADIYITTAIMVKAAAPWARLMYGKFDSMWWQVPNERRVEFAALYAPIVTRAHPINGMMVDFPATFKLQEAA